MYVHSWIFRNRARLRLIYGTPTPEAPSAPVQAASAPVGGSPSAPTPEELPATHLPTGVEDRIEGPLPPASAGGTIQERSQDVVITPMKRRVG